MVRKCKNSLKEKEKNKEQTILEAAEQEFLDKGFEATKTTKIASLAGVSHAMLHYYYRTKENLFDMVFDKKINLLKDSLLVLFENQNKPFLERLQKSIESHFDFLMTNPNLPRFVMNELLFNSKRMSMFEKKIKEAGSHALDIISKGIEAEVKRGTIDPIDPVNLLVDIVSMNVFVFVAMPLLRNFAITPYGNEEAFWEMRKKENVEIILRRLRK